MTVDLPQLRKLGGYGTNGLKALRADLSRRHRLARDRANRWKASYGEVGCYTDLVETAGMYRAVMDALNEWENMEKKT